MATNIKLWVFDSNDQPTWWGGRVGTSFSAPMAAGVFLFLQAYLRYNGIEPDMSELRDVVLEDAVHRPFQFNGRTFDFPTIETHSADAYTNWSEQQPHALDRNRNIICMFDDLLDQWVYATNDNGTPTGPDVTKEIVRRGVLSPHNAPEVLQSVDDHFGL